MLFVCDQCGCVDELELNETVTNDNSPYPVWLCCVCRGQPWHQQFPRHRYDPAHDLVVNRPTGLGLEGD